MKNLLITLVMLLFIGTVSAQETPTTKKAKTSTDTILKSSTTKSSTYKTDTVKTKHPTTKKKSSTRPKSATDTIKP